MSGVVRTVLGDVSPSALGRVSIHEHVAVVGGLACVREPQFRLDDVERICADVDAFRASGGGALVDTMCLVEGRSAQLLTEIARRTGVHVVATTGFHSLAYYTDRHWVHFYDEERLAALILTEIVAGMDELCFNGPDRNATDARAGVIKVAGSLHHVEPTTRKAITAVGLAHRRSGAPVLVHTESGTAGHELLDLLEAAGVPPVAVLLSHLDRNPDIVLHDELAARGAMLSYDWLARTRQRCDRIVAELVLGMVERGHVSRLGVGMDLVRNTYWPAYGGGPGLRYLFGEFVPRLARAGVPEDVLHALCVDNPARFLTFEPRDAA